MSRNFDNSLRELFEVSFFSTLPREPGVYFMHCQKGKILYVGRAKCLRARVRSYRNLKAGQAGRNIEKLLGRVRKITWEPHASLEIAIQRERELIRALVPPYNIADAWEEDYFYIGVRCRDADRIDFRLTGKEEDSEEFLLHGCYGHRRLAKQSYSALLRVLFACAYERDRFYFPATLAGRSPLYNYSMKISAAAEWTQALSSFLNGSRSRFISLTVERLLANEKIPPYVRPALQRDLELLMAFGAQCRRDRRRLGIQKGPVSQREWRSRIRDSLESPVRSPHSNPR